MFRDQAELNNAMSLKFPCDHCEHSAKSLFQLKLHHERTHKRIGFKPSPNQLIQKLEFETVEPKIDSENVKKVITEEIEEIKSKGENRLNRKSE